MRKPTICICENKGADQLCSKVFSGGGGALVLISLVPGHFLHVVFKYFESSWGKHSFGWF